MSKEKKVEITPKVREELDALVRKAAGKDAVDRRLKSCLNPKWHRYEFWGTANGNVVNLNIEAKSTGLMDQKCKTVKDWRRMHARDEKRAERNLGSEKAAKPDYPLKKEAEDDNQVAAPNESRTPNWHRAKNRSQRVRMEGWRRRRLG